MSELTDTDKKVLVRDHDILISVHTLQQEMIRRLDDYIKADGEKHSQTALDIKGLSLEQVRVNGELVAVRDDVKELKATSNRIDFAIAIGTIIAGVIAWFK